MYQQVNGLWGDMGQRYQRIKKDKSLKKKKNVTKTGNAGRRIPAVSEGFPFFAGKKT